MNHEGQQPETIELSVESFADVLFAPGTGTSNDHLARKLDPAQISELFQYVAVLLSQIGGLQKQSELAPDQEQGETEGTDGEQEAGTAHLRIGQTLHLRASALRNVDPENLKFVFEVLVAAISRELKALPIVIAVRLYEISSRLKKDEGESCIVGVVGELQKAAASFPLRIVGRTEADIASVVHLISDKACRHPQHRCRYEDTRGNCTLTKASATAMLERLEAKGVLRKSQAMEYSILI